MTGIPHLLFSADFSRKHDGATTFMLLLLMVKGREIINENGGIEPSVFAIELLKKLFTICFTSVQCKSHYCIYVI